MSVIRLQCRCGRVAGQLAAGSGTLIQCHCADCTRYRAHLQPGETHPAGVDIYQTTPDRIDITQGWDHMACLRLSAQGMHRWYAACCNTAMANCLISPVFPFVGLPVDGIAEADRPKLGKLRAVMQRVVAGGKPQNRNVTTAVWGVMKRGIAARLAGAERHAPFFLPDGTPAKPAEILT